MSGESNALSKMEASLIPRNVSNIHTYMYIYIYVCMYSDGSTEMFIPCTWCQSIAFNVPLMMPDFLSPEPLPSLQASRGSHWLPSPEQPVGVLVYGGLCETEISGDEAGVW